MVVWMSSTTLVKATEVDANNKFLAHHQLVAPFFFTQSGIKPITAIEVSCRYADLYRSYLQADAIIAIGFNFNADDNHINTIFRDLVESKKKHLICTSIYQNKTSTEQGDNIGSLWLDHIIKRLPTILHG